MPTRIEVIQSLKSRDEFQNRDIATILDYLEQVSGNSSGTRATLLESKRRVQDEVTAFDLTAIYNYAAELGTPAITIEAFLEDVAVRRDIVSLDLVNHILDLFDGASFPASQGALTACIDSIGSPFAHWPCNDASSPLVDRISARNVAEINGPTGFNYQTAGPPGVLDIVCVQVGSGLRHFLSTDAAFDTLFGANDSFSAFWIVNHTQDDIPRVIFEKGTAAAGQVQFRAEGVNKAEFTLDDGTATELQQSGSGTLFRKVWRTAGFVRDAAANEMRIYVNGLQVAPSPGVEAGTNTYEDTSDLTLFGRASGQAAEGHFSNFVLYPIAITDANMLKLHDASGV